MMLAQPHQFDWIPFSSGVAILVPRTREIFLDASANSCCIIDDTDYDWAIEYIWALSRGSKQRPSSHEKCYALRRERRGGRQAAVRTFYLHLGILERAVGKKPCTISPRGTEYKIIGDHINGDSLDNRRCNLRYATLSQNNANRFGIAYRQLDFAVPYHEVAD